MHPKQSNPILTPEGSSSANGRKSKSLCANSSTVKDLRDSRFPHVQQQANLISEAIRGILTRTREIRAKTCGRPRRRNMGGLQICTNDSGSGSSTVEAMRGAGLLCQNCRPSDSC